MSLKWIKFAKTFQCIFSELFYRTLGEEEKGEGQLAGGGLPEIAPTLSLPCGSKRGCVAKSSLLGVQAPRGQVYTPHMYKHMRIPGYFLTSSPAPAEAKYPTGSQRWWAWGSPSCFVAISHLHPEGKFSPKLPFLQAMRASRYRRQLPAPGGLQPQVQAQTDLRGKIKAPVAWAAAGCWPATSSPPPPLR